MALCETAFTNITDWLDLSQYQLERIKERFKNLWTLLLLYHVLDFSHSDGISKP